MIDEIVNSSNTENKIIIEHWFIVIHAGIIAEENKDFTVLKKRVIRLGMPQVLKFGMSASESAKFSYGKKWRELDAIMDSLGV